jgi:FeS assembly SUF system protein
LFNPERPKRTEMSEQEVKELEVRGQEVSEEEVQELEVTPQEIINLEEPANLEAPIIAALHTCFDPEIPVDIYELGLIYGIDIEPSGDVNIRMTLTSPGCPVAGSLPGEVEQKVQAVPGVTSAKVELVWDPPWCMENMSEAAKLQLGMF